MALGICIVYLDNYEVPHGLALGTRHLSYATASTSLMDAASRLPLFADILMAAPSDCQVPYY